MRSAIDGRRPTDLSRDGWRRFRRGVGVTAALITLPWASGTLGASAASRASRSLAPPFATADSFSYCEDYSYTLPDTSCTHSASAGRETGGIAGAGSASDGPGASFVLARSVWDLSTTHTLTHGVPSVTYVVSLRLNSAQSAGDLSGSDVACPDYSCTAGGATGIGIRASHSSCSACGGSSFNPITDARTNTPGAPASQSRANEELAYEVTLTNINGAKVPKGTVTISVHAYGYAVLVSPVGVSGSAGFALDAVVTRLALA